MRAKCTIDYIDPADGTKIKPSSVKFGEVTDAYRYFSTLGYPGTERSLIKNTANPEACAGGIVCFENNIGDEDFFKYNDKCVAFATKYNTDAKTTDISSKYGKKLTDRTSLGRTKFSQTWEWGTTQGNGSIQSIALTNLMAFDLFSDEPYVYTSGATTAVGSDCRQIGSGLSDDAVNPDSSNYIDNNSSYIHNRYSYYNNWNFNYSSFLPFYVTENNLIFVYLKSVEQSGSNYIHTFWYKRIPLKALQLYPEDWSFNKHMNLLTIPNLYNPQIEEFSGSFTYTSAYQFSAKLPAASAGDNNYIIENNGYCLFFNTYSASDTPDESWPAAWPSHYAVRYLKITGDTPTVTVIDSVYNTAIATSYGWDRRSGPVIFLDDDSYVYSVQDGTDSYYAHRKLQSNTLVVKKTTTIDTCNVGLSRTQPNVIFLKTGNDSKNVYGKIINKSNLSDTGYYFKCAYDDLFSGASVHGIQVRNSDKNPFFLTMFSHGGSSAPQSPVQLYYTNYIFSRFIFTTPIVKTSDFIMRITIEVDLED